MTGTRYKKVINTSGQEMLVRMTEEEITEERKINFAVIPVGLILGIVMIFAWLVR